jgi:hypothetical protein
MPWFFSAFCFLVLSRLSSQNNVNKIIEFLNPIFLETKQNRTGNRRFAVQEHIHNVFQRYEECLLKQLL